MVPTQIQLTESQVRILERIAAEKELSVVELIHQSIDDLIQHTEGSDSAGPLDAEREERRRRALSIIGAFSSEEDDLAENHDQYLAIAYADPAGDA